MKTSTLLTCLGMLSLPPFLQAQQTIQHLDQDPSAAANSVAWVGLSGTSEASASTFWDRYSAELGLAVADEMQLVKTSGDRIGWRHYQYQQIHRGLPVEFAVYRLHEKDGMVQKGNGELAQVGNIGTTPAVSRNAAFVRALQCVGAARYYWEVPQYEAMKQFATDDPQATFYPAGELLIVDRDFDPKSPAEYHLAWKFEIYAAEPEGRRWIYVDAHTGEILKEMDLDIHEGFPGTAETRYSGLQEIVADSTEFGYVLQDKSRGKGVYTFDAMDSTDLQYAVDFIDDDNYWANANPRADDAATDAHWGVEVYYDYLMNRHGINSYDNEGSRLISYVHYDRNWRNASWAGFWTRFGDASGDPWTFIDVVGHEFTHGMTWAFSALLYERESGALNESFSDIIGESLQHYAHGATDWYATPAPSDTIRSYVDPKSYGDPDTYLGEHWEFTASDNYGVHTNSGVQNYWFYLLSEGGSGTNDNGDAYTVDALGIEKAIDIAMRNLTVYLFPTADYFDARQGSLQAAEDLFGRCSDEYQQVANAWHAVGVGERVELNDFSVTRVEPMELCAVNTMAPVSIHIKHFGCDTTGPVTLVLTLTKSNPTVIFSDTLEIPQGFGPGEEFAYSFSKMFDFSRKGEHVLSAKIAATGDANPQNDGSKAIVNYQLSQVSEQAFPFHNRFALRTFRDSIAFQVGDFADLDVLPSLGVDSTVGIRVQGDRMRYANPVYEGQDVFNINQRLGAQICMCVDARELDSLGLQFDLRQTYSSTFEETVGEPQPKSSAMRVMADTTELARYFPETNNEDLWTTHNLDLEDYLGTEFRLCFETRTIQSITEDRDSIGDRVFLDNIAILSRSLETSGLRNANVRSLSVYPNPASGEVFLDVPVQQPGDAIISLTDVNGRVYLQQSRTLVAGSNQFRVDLGQYASGVYVIEVRTAGERMVARVVH